MHKRNKLPKLLPYVSRTHNSNTIFKAKSWHPNQSQQLNSKLYLQIITITRQRRIAYSPYQTAKVVRLRPQKRCFFSIRWFHITEAAADVSFIDFRYGLYLRLRAKTNKSVSITYLQGILATHIIIIKRKLILL